MVQRRRGWRSALLAWATKLPGQPFEWGRTDCGALARDALVVLFGPDLMAFMPAYHTVDEARAVREAYPPADVLRRLGAQQVTLPFRRAGDIILTGEPDEPVGRQSIAVCVDGRIGIASTRHGPAVIDCAALPDDSQCFTLWEANVIIAPPADANAEVSIG